MFPIFFLLFTAVPAIELYLLFTVGAQIGALNTIFIIIATGIVGAALAKAQGLSLIYQVQHDLNQGKVPATKIIEGFSVFGGGLLLLTPGFATDILGFCMIIPGTRHIMAAFIKRMFMRGIEKGNIQFNFFGNMGNQQSGFGNNNPFSQGQNPFEQNQYESYEAEFEYKEDNNDQNVISVDFEKKDEKDL